MTILLSQLKWEQPYYPIRLRKDAARNGITKQTLKQKPIKGHNRTITSRLFYQPLGVSPLKPCKILEMGCTPTWLDTLCCLLSCCFWLAHLENIKAFSHYPSCYCTTGRDQCRERIPHTWCLSLYINLPLFSVFKLNTLLFFIVKR